MYIVVETVTQLRPTLVFMLEGIAAEDEWHCAAQVESVAPTAEERMQRVQGELVRSNDQSAFVPVHLSWFHDDVLAALKQMSKFAHAAGEDDLTTGTERPVQIVRQWREDAAERTGVASGVLREQSSISSSRPPPKLGESTMFELYDTTYRSFSPFNVWGQTHFDPMPWEQAAEHLLTLSPDAFAQVQRRIKRLAAVETGVIEMLYPGEPRLIASAEDDAAWGSTLADCDERLQSLLVGHLAADDEVQLFAAEQLPISEVWIRQLHVIMCAAQQTVTVSTVAGPQQHALLLGTYKRQPNHFYYTDGRIHAYCPVERVAEEMQRLCREMRSDLFTMAHPLLQLSYAHFGLAAIHPFQDGNGRSSRALASLYTYQALGLPLLVPAVDKVVYFDALEAADGGNPQPIVEFLLDKVVATVRLCTC